MLQRFRTLLRNTAQFRPSQLYLLEAALVSVFFVQALRFLIPMIYSRLEGASVIAGLPPDQITTAMLDIADPVIVSAEIAFLPFVLFLPIIAVLLGRFRVLFIFATVLAAVGRALMLSDSIITPTSAAIITVGAGLLYVALLARHRAAVLPIAFVLSFATDQMFRAAGNTLDPSWSSNYAIPQYWLSAALVIISVIALIIQIRTTPNKRGMILPDYGLLPLSGGIGFGALLYLQIALLAMPNAIAGRTDTDQFYSSFAPALIAVTLLPLVPFVRRQARAFIMLFDSSVRGWIWLLLIGLLLVIGLRFQGIIGAVALIAAQFAVSLLWWWLVRPRTEKERSFGGLWLSFGMLLFLLLIIFDTLTFNYAYLRPFAPGLDILNITLLPLMRGFRGLGLGVMLIAALLSILPMLQTSRRVPWIGVGDKPVMASSPLQTLLTTAFIILMSLFATNEARPAVIEGVTDSAFRVATYNIHGGYSEFFERNLEELAQNISESGAAVVLLQEVEVGRMTSFGVDQALWLGRRLRMAVRYYPTVEGLRGLAVLSKVNVLFDDGLLLSSTGEQTGVQRVQISPGAGEIVNLYNVWLGLLVQPVVADPEARPIENQEQDQQRQLLEIIAIIQQDPNWRLGRTVLGGTFNNIPDAPLLDLVRNLGFEDAFAGLPPELSDTLCRTNAVARLDYVWLLNLPREGTSIIPQDCAGASVFNPSDHRLASAAIRLER